MGALFTEKMLLHVLNILFWKQGHELQDMQLITIVNQHQ
jgi:hypothetical protein